ncbi:putative ABC transporter permease [Desulfonispora thiosulfatigenes]|nr:hypothetical protein [Desulfonispora thiosulfatigenes]
MLKRYVLYGLIGWIIEVIWTGLGSLLEGRWTLDSQTYLWMFFIYGFAIFLEPIHDLIRQYNWFFRGLIYMSVIFLIEYTTGYILDLAIGACPWEYAGKIYAVNGYIRLDYGPAWFGAGLLFEHIHDKSGKLIAII